MVWTPYPPRPAAANASCIPTLPSIVACPPAIVVQNNSALYVLYIWSTISPRCGMEMEYFAMCLVHDYKLMAELEYAFIYTPHSLFRISYKWSKDLSDKFNWRSRAFRIRNAPVATEFHNFDCLIHMHSRGWIYAFSDGIRLWCRKSTKKAREWHHHSVNQAIKLILEDSKF